jgi:AhpD family alkylhydroperoxidase
MQTQMEKAVTTQPRMKSPGAIIPEAAKAIQALIGSIHQGGVPSATLELVHLRASQINGCSFCVNMGWSNAKKAGETDERIFMIAAWREAPFYSEAERAALALTEAVTRLRATDPVPDDIWNEAAKHYDERGLAALLLMIGTTNLFNRLNISIKQPAGAGW